MERTKAQSSKIHILLNQLGVDKETKEDILAQFTNGRTASSKHLSFEEAKELIRKLEREVMKDSPSHGKGRELTDYERGDAMRKKILHYAHLMGWKKEDGRADMDRLQHWCLKYGQYHKPLHKHSYKELVGLTSQFEKVYLDTMGK